MPTSILDQLTTLAQQFRVDRVVPTEPTSQRDVRLKLVPPAPPEGKPDLSVSETITKLELQDKQITLDLLMKDVRFNVTDVNQIKAVTAESPLKGGRPIASLASQLENVTLGATDKPGLPGVIGTLSGKIPFMVPVEQVLEEKVSVSVRWSIRDEAGNIVSDVEWRLGSQSGTSGEIIPTPAQVLEILQLGLPVIFTEANGLDLPIVQRFIHASIRLSGLGQSTPWIDLPRVPVPLPVVPVPTILTMFVDSNFQSLAMMVVPGDSPLPDNLENKAVTALNTLNATLNNLTTLPPGVTFPSPLAHLVGTVEILNTLVDKLNNTQIAFLRASEIKNLNETTLKQRPWFQNDTEAEDEMSSLVLIGPPGRRARFFNDQHFSDDEGQFYATIGKELIVAVPTLHSASPASTPAGKLTVVSQPRGSRLGNSDINIFGDELSSLRFEWAE